MATWSDAVSIFTIYTDEIQAAALYLGGDPINGTPGTLMSASSAELNKLASVTDGTTSASKALVVDADKALDELHLAALYLGAGAGTQVTSTAAELNFLDGSTAGTTVASKALVVDADKAIDFLQLLSGSGAVNTAVLLGGGTAGSPNTTATPSKNFIEFRCSTTATDAGSDTRTAYLRLYLDGATTGGGDAVRSFATVNAACGTAHGAHLSLNFGASGSLSGLGVAGRNTLHIPNNASFTSGTLAALQAEIYSDGTDSDPDGLTELSFIRIVNDGHADGIADVDDDAFLLAISGGSIDAGNMMAAQSAAAVSHTLRIKGPDGSTYYLMVSDTQ